MRFAIELQPRFGYGRLPHKLDLSEHGAVSSMTPRGTGARNELGTLAGGKT